MPISSSVYVAGGRAESVEFADHSTGKNGLYEEDSRKLNSSSFSI